MSEGSGQRYCGNCGAEIRSGISFCVSCGRPLNGGAASPGPDNSLPPIPSRSLADTLKETFQGLTERFSNARSASGGASLGGLPNKALNWFKDLSSVPKLVIVGLVLLLVAVLLSPVLFFVGLVLILIGIVAVVINLIRRKSFKKWGIGTGAAVAFTFIIGITSNVVYNTNSLWGIGYELSSEEQEYLYEVDMYQDYMLKAIDGQATVVESYPNITEQESVRAMGYVGQASLWSGAAKDISVPSGCEEHHEVWTQAMETLSYSAASGSDFMVSGSSEDEYFARFHRREGMGYLDEANRIYNRIERQGC